MKNDCKNIIFRNSKACPTYYLIHSLVSLLPRMNFYASMKYDLIVLIFFLIQFFKNNCYNGK